MLPRSSIILFTCLAGRAAAQDTCADLNGDGEVNVADLLTLLGGEACDVSSFRLAWGGCLEHRILSARLQLSAPARTETSTVMERRTCKTCWCCWARSGRAASEVAPGGRGKRQSDAAKFILCRESPMKYTKRRLNDSIAHG